MVLYTHKIDMWAYGYAIAEILGYSVQKYPSADGFSGHNPSITRNRHAAILGMLRAHCKKAAEDEPLVDLAAKLLAWQPAERWSAAHALEHDCWAPITQNRDEDGGAEQGTVQGGRPQVKKIKLGGPNTTPSDRPSPHAIDDLTSICARNVVQAKASTEYDTQVLSEETLAKYLEGDRCSPSCRCRQRVEFGDLS